MDVIRRVLVALALSLALLAGRAPAALAEAAPAASPTPEQVRQLLGLLADPAVRDWIARGAPAPPAADSPSPPAQQPVTLGQYLRERLVAIRAHLIGLATAVPDVPDELAHAWLILSLEFEEQGLLSVLLLIAAFAALGFGAQRLFWRLTRGWRRQGHRRPARHRGRAAEHRLPAAALRRPERRRLRARQRRRLPGLLLAAAAPGGRAGRPPRPPRHHDGPHARPLRPRPGRPALPRPADAAGPGRSLVPLVPRDRRLRRPGVRHPGPAAHARRLRAGPRPPRPRLGRAAG